MLFVREIFEQLSYSLRRIDILLVQMTSDLVVLLNLQRDLIAIFVNVLVNVFYDFHNRAHFYINVSLISTSEIRVIRNHSAIVKREFTIVEKLYFSCAIILTTTIRRIRIFLNRRSVSKLSRIMLEADVELVFR
jgi:hypothetical protein